MLDVSKQDLSASLGVALDGTDRLKVLAKESPAASNNPNENVTADKQLYPLKSRCQIFQYMPNKLEKLAIKFWVLANAEQLQF
ncbi:hypothetical protein J437_LFUL018756 [Ladona fulva]|uniref:Uncharacterized protein n=1 Tax=Ladona fulva TaxID=123851 RepID=A0A8K0KQR9_LADFU|nr:hypothetical protein J437_LFUL018756 [Ladona fulva]